MLSPSRNNFQISPSKFLAPSLRDSAGKTSATKTAERATVSKNQGKPPNHPTSEPFPRTLITQRHEINQTRTSPATLAKSTPSAPPRGTWLPAHLSVLGNAGRPVCEFFWEQGGLADDAIAVSVEVLSFVSLSLPANLDTDSVHGERESAGFREGER